MAEKPKRAGITRRPYQRMFAIHRAISKGGYPNCSTLAEELEVTPKTIQRDIDFMRDNFGVIIEYDDKRHGFHAVNGLPDFPGFVMGAEELAALFLTRTALESIRGDRQLAHAKGLCWAALVVPEISELDEDHDCSQKREDDRQGDEQR